MQGISIPRYARAARFDYDTKRVSCTPGTRIETLDTIYHWFNGQISETGQTLSTEGNPKGRIFWLDGVAGTGKSTISQTVADHFNRTHELGASFFCSRDDGECSNISLVFSTIAYQLSLRSPSFQKHLSEVIEKDPDIQYALASMQLEKLVMDPLRAAIREESFPPCLVVLDALDECKDENATSVILLSLSVFAGRLSPLRFFITSRPVSNVLRGFRGTDLMTDTNSLVLHNIPLDISQKDIRVYLEKRLSRVSRSPKLKDWPPSEALARLVEKSDGLFIFAATAANFIEDRNASNPIQQLKIVLTMPYITSTATSPHLHLDGLYLTVLRSAFPEVSEDQRTRLRVVLGTIALLFDRLDPDSLEALLCLEEGTVWSTLEHLHSIAIVPEARGGCVQLIHPSFHDFLIDMNRCNDSNFSVDPALQHGSVAKCCLQVLQSLSQDICKIGNPSICNHEVTDLPLRIATHVHSNLQYACRYWASHLASGDIDNAVLELLLSFCSNQLLNWLEVMSLLGELDCAVAALQSAHRIVKVSNLD